MKRKLYWDFVERAKGSRQFGRHRRRWKNKNKMDLKENVYDRNDWINLDQDREIWRAVVETVKKGQIL